MGPRGRLARPLIGGPGGEQVAGRGREPPRAGRREAGLRGALRVSSCGGTGSIQRRRPPARSPGPRLYFLLPRRSHYAEEKVPREYRRQRWIQSNQAGAHKTVCQVVSKTCSTKT